jgi:S-methylmethionine-dependent homocysteine/selenocysteine methylase
VKDEYRETIEAFVDAGVDLLLFETFNSIAEANVALDAAREIGAPAWMAFAPDGGNRLLGGEPIAQAVEEVYCDVMLLNCAPPAHIETGLDTLAKRRSGPVGVYPHIGRFDPPEWMFTDEFPPDRYASEAARWFRTGARVIGGCCGVTPAHTDAVNRQLRNTIEPVPGKSEEQ